MLRTLTTYLWKEWRDHRAIVIGLLLAVPLLLAIAKFAMPEKLFEHPVFPPVTALSCYLIALLSIGSDLVPGEARRNRLDFLRRLPADLTAPFIAKAIFLGAMLTAFTWYGWGLACWFGKVPDKTHEGLTYVAFWSYCLAPWVFAVSCWLPRGALAVPGAALALALLGLPPILIYSAPYSPTPRPDQIATLVYGIAGWSLVVAWVSWARGMRFGRSIGAAAWRGLAVALVLFLPVWAYAGYSVRAWREIDPQAKHFTIASAVLSADERTVYLNARNFGGRSVGPFHVLKVDLATGDWTRLGGLGDRVILPLPMRTKGEAILTRFGLRKGPIVAIMSARSSKRYAKGSYIQQAWLTYFDADSGERIKSGWQDMDLPEVRARFGDSWIDLPEGFAGFSLNGSGYALYSKSWGRLYDPFRKKLYASGPKDFRDLLIRKGRWLATARKKGGGSHLYDPDTKTGVPAKGIPTWKRPAHMQLLDDGRVLYSWGKQTLLTDPESGETAVLARDSARASFAGTTLDGASIFLMVTKEGEFRIARLSPRANALTYLESRATGTPLAAFFDGSLLCTQDGKRLIRARFGSDEVEVLWPR